MKEYTLSLTIDNEEDRDKGTWTRRRIELFYTPTSDGKAYKVYLRIVRDNDLGVSFTETENFIEKEMNFRQEFPKEEVEGLAEKIEEFARQADDRSVEQLLKLKGHFEKLEKAKKLLSFFKK